MNTAPNAPRHPAPDYRARARARRRDDRDQALKSALAGRTLDTAPSTDLSSDERRERMARTSIAFEGL
jgi:hypothetical protein